MSNEKLTRGESRQNKNKISVFIRLFIVVAVIVFLSEFIGTKKIPFGPGQVVLLPMLYAVIIGLIITPDILGKKLTFLKELLSEEEIEMAGAMVMLALLPLGVKYGALVGPNIIKIIEAGPALLLQELGNLATILIGLPIALLLGLKREAFGATVSICREPTLGVITERYGINSPEGTGVLGTYLVGTVFGTIFFGLLGSLAVRTGLHPYALAMASGMGSGSMMTAGSAALAATVPEMKDAILAYAATSNMLTGLTGVYSVIFLGIPLCNYLYKKLEPKLGKKGGHANVK
ncbi:DUF3100 domain-containing protein [Maledivibacter halophilus]|uniref:DUF3100 domain-containing protein n=1 Tax=Maledivibacter halophilus TaxID=36842 RepID=A0A1T5IKU3_9FIRM|nr:DUF3100 domain-containing protein [Maledivibacter halophilus]SKC39801.1 Protein of unknown function [Maledivibacter halophilus]